MSKDVVAQFAEIVGEANVLTEDADTAQEFLLVVHEKGKPVANGPVVAARERRGLPTRRYAR